LVVAIVAPADHVFGIVRMWEALAAGTGWRTRAFRNRSEAQAWLAATDQERSFVGGEK
jgi:hypothetical protein